MTSLLLLLFAAVMASLLVVTSQTTSFGCKSTMAVSSVVALDREELIDGVLARDLIGKKTNSKLLSIATISQLVDFFHQTEKTEEAQLIEDYLSKQ